MRTLFETTKTGPQFTIRLLLDRVEFVNPEITAPQLKPFSHFTLGCTADDRTEQLTKIFDELLAQSASKNTLLSFEPIQVKNLTNDENNPLWAIELKISEELRSILASHFDDMMCPETDGNLYLWGNGTKCPHITLGRTMEDKSRGEEVLKGSVFHFSRLDYKRVGKHDAHLFVELNQSHLVPTQKMSP